jgi:predicted DCC family thiol-disulfide oxidoreductase YuxK
MAETMRSSQRVTETLFYDGHCGLCHRAVKFVLRHDPTGAAFRFAPLQGPTFEAAVPADQRAGLPDTMVLRTFDGRLLLKSQAWLHIMRRLGGFWKLAGTVCSAVPRPIGDWCYDFIAAVRFRMFGRRDDLCPIIAPTLRSRFDP